MNRMFLIALAVLFSQQSMAVESLTEIVSDVYAAEGMTAQQIAERGFQCIKSSSGNVADKVEPAMDGDTAYAIVLTGYTSGLLRGIARSRISVVAKEARFKVAHSNIEFFNELANGYIGIQKRWGTGWQKVEESLKARSSGVADCIMKKQETPGGDNW